jgi:phenylacetate-coenzyme A ligase PaaK-like adenylate-forming protein
VAATSEVLRDETVLRAREAWRIGLQNVYAATEAPGIAITSLDDVGMHVFEGSLVLEVVDEQGRAVPAGVPGAKVLVTSLVNRAQPLIRYELSDSVVLADGDDPSGRPYLRIERVDGRTDDILRFPGAGGEVRVYPHRLRAPFIALSAVSGYQLVHERGGRLRARVVPRLPAARDLVDRVQAALVRELRDAGVASPEVEVELVEEIERERGPAAKVKLVRSERE